MEAKSEPWSQSPVRQATRPTDQPTLPSCSGLAVNWGPCAPCRQGMGWRRSHVRPGLPFLSPRRHRFASWFLPSWARLLASWPFRGHIWCLPPGLGCQGPSELRPVPHFPSAYPSGWPVSLTPAALHPNAVRTFSAVNFRRTPSSPATNSKHCSLQACPPGILPEPGHCPSLPPSLRVASDLTWPQNQRMVVKSKSDLSFRGTPS